MKCHKYLFIPHWDHTGIQLLHIFLDIHQWNPPLLLEYYHSPIDLYLGFHLPSIPYFSPQRIKSFFLSSYVARSLLCYKRYHKSYLLTTSNGSIYNIRSKFSQLAWAYCESKGYNNIPYNHHPQNHHSLSGWEQQLRRGEMIPYPKSTHIMHDAASSSLSYSPLSSKFEGINIPLYSLTVIAPHNNWRSLYMRRYLTRDIMEETTPTTLRG